MLFPLLAWSTPKTIEVWFLSPPKHGMTIEWSQAFAQNDEDIDLSTWRKMGDDYFHPQYGLYSEYKKSFEKKDELEEKVEARQVKYLSNIETDLINCDKDYYFDLYCGKKVETKMNALAPLEVWVDTSSSLTSIDPSDEQGGCFRKSFINHLENACSKFATLTFDTALKLMGSKNTLCLNYGLNDQNRLMDWIKATKAQHLIVITDIYEYTKKLTDFLDSIGGATLRGHEVGKPLLAKDIARMEVSKTWCGP